ncbi:hypothetical protein IAU59_005279 [Kwoniella sp. CBS 9459]
MFSNTIPILAALFYLAANPVRADYSPAFLGCINGATSIASTFTIEGQSNAVECARECYASKDPTFYSFFMQGYVRDEVLVPAQCLCTEIQPESSTYVPGGSSNGQGYCDTGAYEGYVTASSFAFVDCYDGFEGSALEMGAIDGVEDCLVLCKSMGYAIVEPLSAELTCYCGYDYGDDPTLFNTPGTCGQNHFFVYQHEAGSAVGSGFVKRQLRERLRMSAKKRYATCPQPLTACNVAGVRNSFECINTDEELESCGGCVTGDFNDAYAPAAGVDCTALPGIPRGAVTCTAGRCEAFACKSGYQLASNGTCIAL